MKNKLKKTLLVGFVALMTFFIWCEEKSIFTYKYVANGNTAGLIDVTKVKDNIYRVTILEAQDDKSAEVRYFLFDDEQETMEFVYTCKIVASNGDSAVQKGDKIMKTYSNIRAKDDYSKIRDGIVHTIYYTTTEIMKRDDFSELL